MTCSPARLAANRANARKSTGPKTPEGKEASRGNALKHGLAAEVVVPLDEAAEVARRAEALEREMRPSGELGRILVRRVAVLSVRLDRCVRHEAACLEKRIRDAEAARAGGPEAAEDSPATDRPESAELALFDPSRDAELARKYEAATERGLYRALREFRQAEAEADAEARAAEEVAAEESADLGSFEPEADPIPTVSARAPVVPPTRPVVEPSPAPEFGSPASIRPGTA